ncbi:GH25 family lysozyme [Tabrizicola oligotrophica]|uniref:Glycoside hydrolase n=1 Tax=Tabrizicola oligotrophica TaxID=2710650 RepID=A0A6M0QTM7_9RHOB|nr:GH25 family lysozyme [Tabrizicola oligotrophica]NEY90785.1 glycoside hydrolase [Tabrizicola oligotrophica]
MPHTFAHAPLLASLCLALAACGGGRAPEPDARPAAEAPVTTASFSDSDPHPETARARRYAVHGVDVARFQTAVDWQAARESGVNFAFIKATEGGDMVDPMFKDHWRDAGRAGVRRGAYLFYYHCRAPEEQARWFFRHVPKAPGSLPPVLDMEWTPTSPTCTIRREASVIRRDAAVIVAMLTEHYGTAPLLYTTVDFFEDNELWRLSGVEFWLRSVAAHPSDRYPGQPWTFWQYTSTGLVPGIGGKADINVFAGGEVAWADWLARRSVQ